MWADTVFQRWRREIDRILLAAGGGVSAASAGLRVNSAARYASPFGAGVISGQFYDQSFGGTAPGTLAGAAGRLDLSPFYAPFDFTVDQIGVAVSTNVASALARCVIYSADADGWPDTRLFYGASDLDLNVLGYRPHTASFTFLAGVPYWVGVHQSSTATLRTTSVSGAPNLGVNGSNGTNYFTILRRTVTYASGAPATWNFVSGDRANALPVSIRMRAA